MKLRRLALPLLLLCTVFWVAFAVAAAPVPEPEAETAACSTAGGANLLANPSFEGQYSAYIPPNGHPDCPTGICNTAQMAAGWTPFWRSHDPNEPDPTIIRMPEYKPATLGVPGPPRVRPGGERAQQYFTFWATHEAGFYQQVPVTPGMAYCFTIWGHSWSSTDDDPWTSTPGWPLYQRLGIDPTGGDDWLSPGVIWGPSFEQYNEYAQFSVLAVAQATQMTVFVHSLPVWPAKHNDVYWDDAALVPMSAEPASLSVYPQQLRFIAQAGAPSIVPEIVKISLAGSPGIMWQATVDSSGGLNPALNASSGGPGDDLTVTVDSAAYGLGAYTATITLSTTQPAAGSPVDIPVTLLVVSELHETHLPTIERP